MSKKLDLQRFWEMTPWGARASGKSMALDGLCNKGLTTMKEGIGNVVGKPTVRFNTTWGWSWSVECIDTTYLSPLIIQERQLSFFIRDTFSLHKLKKIIDHKWNGDELYVKCGGYRLDIESQVYKDSHSGSKSNIFSLKSFIFNMQFLFMHFPSIMQP